MNKAPSNNAAGERIILNTGALMPQIGLGTWKTRPEVVGKAVETAILECGYRHIDCAARYGNEAEIGQSLNKIFTTKQIKRSEIFITGKLWNTEHKPQKVVKACKKSLTDLRLDYLDLYLVHWGVAMESDNNFLDKNGVIKPIKAPLHETWKAMEELIKEGLVKAIGAANYTAPMLYDLFTYAKIMPAVNQIELHPYNPQNELTAYCQYNKIAVTGYSPLGSPNPGNKEHGEPVVLEDKAVIEIAKKHQKFPAQILLRWAIQRGTIAIPKSTNADHLKANIDIFDFSLENEEMNILNNLPTRHRYVNPLFWWKMPYFN
jgi:diketogulonate reductase-like aldo/keto reductase